MAAQLGPLGLQVHSYNDLRETVAVLRKAEASARSTVTTESNVSLFWKLDPQYQPAAVCRRFVRAAPDPRGCFVFNHDDASGAAARTNFNTSDDLVEMLRRGVLNRWAAAESNSSLTISLCFKGCGGKGCPCDSSDETHNWTSLVDDLLASIDALRLPTLTVLLDGAGNPGSASCLYQRWRPHRSVFISGDDPDGAFTSSNASVGWDRLVVLNEPTGSFPVAAALGFGKFAGAGADGSGQLPYIIWEPSDAQGIATAAKAYATSPAAPNPAGLRYAINIDPAQFDVYSAAAVAALPNGTLPARSSGGWHERVASAANTPTLDVLPQNLTADGPLIVVVWADEAVGGALRYTLRIVSAVGAPLAETGSGLLPIAVGAPPRGAAWGLSPLQFADGSSALIYTLAVSDGAGAVTVTEETLWLRLVNPAAAIRAATTFTFISGGPPSSPPAGAPSVTLAAGGSPFAARATVCGSSAATSRDDACRLWVWPAANTTRNNNCLLRAALFGGPRSSAFSLGASSICVATVADATSPLLGSVAAEDVDSVAVGAAPYVLGGSVDARVAIAISYAARGFVFGATACAIDAQAGGGAGINNPACFDGGALVNGSQLLPLTSHVGTQPAIKLSSLQRSPSGGTPLLVLAAHSNASCPNSEAKNKRADIGLCDQPPVWSAGAPYLAYSYGEAADWTRQLLAAVALALPFNGTGTPPTPAHLPSPWPGVTACNADIAHGSWGQGRFPSIAAIALPLSLPSDESTEYAVAVVVQEVEGSSVADPLQCGAPAPAGAVGTHGISLQGWRAAKIPAMATRL